MHPPVPAVRTRVSSVSRSAIRWCLVLSLLVVAGACDDSSPTEAEEDGDVTGLWTASYADQVTSQQLTAYVRITGTSVEFMEGRDDACFNTETLEIVSREGDEFIVQRPGATTTFTLTLRVEGDQLLATGLKAFRLTMDRSSDDTSGFDACLLEGRWGGLNNSDYVVIADSFFTVYTPRTASCHGIILFALEPQGGDRYRLQERYSDGFIAVNVENRAGTLVVTFGDGGALTYNVTDDDVTALEVCGGGDDNDIACSELPPITIGEPITASLSDSDAKDPDLTTYYDMYGLTLSSQTQVQIDITSGEIDTYLRVWDGGGAFLAENDDANANTFDSSLTLTLDAACYRIEASSWGAEETGEYTVAVN